MEAEELKRGVVYRLRARNIACGVYDGQGGFIGIRTKFGGRFLDREYWGEDAAKPIIGEGLVECHGTAYPKEKLADLPEGIEVAEGLGTKDEITGRLIEFDKPVDQGGKGWYFLDTGERAEKARPIGIPNTQLFEFLDQLLKR